MINWAEKVALQAGYYVYEDMQHGKLYVAPPSFPNSPIENPTPHNFTVGVKPPKTTDV